MAPQVRDPMLAILALVRLTQARCIPILPCVLIVDGSGKYIFAALDTIEYLEQQIKQKGKRPNETR